GGFREAGGVLRSRGARVRAAQAKLRAAAALCAERDLQLLVQAAAAHGVCRQRDLRDRLRARQSVRDPAAGGRRAGADGFHDAGHVGLVPRRRTTRFDRVARRVPRPHLRRGQGAAAVYCAAALSRRQRIARCGQERRTDAVAMNLRAPTVGRWAIVAAMLGLYYTLALSAAARKSMTFDEMAHLTGGYSYWAFNDYRLHPENGNWPQRLAALPAVIGHAAFPRLD